MNKQRITGARLLACTAAILAVIGSSLVAQGGVGQGGGRGGGAPQGDPATAPTPRLPNGKPDLTGSWAGGRLHGSGAPGCDRWANVPAVHAVPVEELHGVDQPERGLAVHVDHRGSIMRQPMYKPEHWDKMIELDQWTNRDDPVMTCLPLGHSEAGTAGANLPHRYRHHDALQGRGRRRRRVRGVPHGPDRREAARSSAGRTATRTWGTRSARWEGDTLVLDSIGFSDETWLGRGGCFHSDQMRVVEKFTRTGNQMLYEVTVEDPEVLVEPWVMPSRTLRLVRHQHDHRRAGKLHGERAERSLVAVSTLR